PSRPRRTSQLHRLGYRRVWWNAAHLQKLITAESQDIVYNRLQRIEPSADERRQNVIEAAAHSKGPVDELLDPGVVSRIQPNTQPGERTIGEVASANRAENLESDHARLRHPLARGLCRFPMPWL